jgi:mitochondrial import inner membrane translocase subunit TIM16
MQRVVAQIIITATNVLAKAFMQAYQQAKAGGGGARQAAGNVMAANRMDLSQARQILNIETKTPTREEIMKQFNKYYAANDPEKGGSFYLQSKIHNAAEALMDDLKAQAAAQRAAPKGAAGGSGSSSSSSYIFFCGLVGVMQQAVIWF